MEVAIEQHAAMWEPRGGVEAEWRRCGDSVRIAWQCARAAPEVTVEPLKDVLLDVLGFCNFRCALFRAC